VILSEREFDDLRRRVEKALIADVPVRNFPISAGLLHRLICELAAIRRASLSTPEISQ
jgi:hypothetical protein